MYLAVPMIIVVVLEGLSLRLLPAVQFIILDTSLYRGYRLANRSWLSLQVDNKIVRVKDVFAES